MPRFEYKIVPAPEKSEKIKGLKGPARFAATLEEVMNDLGAEGWQYLRADTLPVEERTGLASKQTTYRNLLVFMREIPDPVIEAPRPAEPPLTVPEPPEPPAEVAEIVEIDEVEDTQAPPDPPDADRVLFNAQSLRRDEPKP